MAELSSSKLVTSVDPWVRLFTPSAVEHMNLKQKQHKKYQREMVIVDFVFQQCALVGRDEVTLNAEAIVLPFRFSDKHGRYKTDLYVLAPCAFLYPLRLHTAAQKQLYDITYSATCVTLCSKQTGEEKVLRVRDKIPVQVHCCKAAAALRKKCVLSSPSVSFA